MQAGIFQDNAHILCDYGLAVIPLDGKKPLVGNFNKLTKPPAPKVIDRWSARFGNANIGVVAGPSKLIIIDCDDPETAEQAEQIFGPTPLRALTYRGRHLYYSDTTGTQKNANLRKFGLNIDVKCGAGFVVAPPSVHPSGLRYRLDDGCDWTALSVLSRVAPFKVSAMEQFRRADRKQLDPVSEGNRANALNAAMCREVSRSKTIDDLLVAARLENESFLPHLHDDEVVRISQRVWADMSSGKLSRWRGGPAKVRIDHDDIVRLLQRSPKGSDAIALLLHLKASHGARCGRGEPFSITPKAIASKKVMGDWSRRRVESARDLLVECGLINRVREFKRRGEGALYMLKIEQR